MQGNMVQKTKFYFIILAAIMTLSLTYVMFKWGAASKVYKITSHETHVHIQQLPAMDKPLQLSAVRHLELQLTTTPKPRLESEPGLELKPGLEAKLGIETKPELELKPGLDLKPGVESNDGSETKSGTESDIPRNETVIENHSSHSVSKLNKDIHSPTTKPSSTLTRITPSTGKISALNSVKVLQDKEVEKPQTKTKDLKTQNNLHEKKKKESDGKQEIVKDIRDVNNINQNANKSKTNLDEEKEKKQTEISNQTSTAEINDSETLKQDYEEYDQDKQTAHSNTVVGIEKSNTAQETEIIKETQIDTKPDTKKENEKTGNAINKDQDETNVNLPKASTTIPLMEIAALNESFIEEKLLMAEHAENSPNVGDENDQQREPDNHNTEKVHEKDQNINIDIEKSNTIPKDNSERLNHEDLKFENNAINPTVTTVKATIIINDDYDNRRRKVEERLKMIKEQLINRTIITDGDKVSSKERLQNIRADNMQIQNYEMIRNDGIRGKSDAGPMNRYLQQRLRQLGFRNKMNSMFSNTNDNNGNIDVMLQREGKTSRPDMCRRCFTMDFRRIINEENTCKGADIDILILISTSPQNKDARDAIRTSWCKSCKGNNSKIKYLFVLGNSSNDDINAEIKEESNNNHDIIQIDFKDSYANLTYKTITGLKWANDYCANAKYVMKTDDDMYVNTELLPLLLKQTPLENFLGGFCWGPSQPHRDANSKWYVPYQSYRGSWFPSMCSGTGYILSSDIIPRILATSRNIPFFHLEDVYIAICLNKIGLHPTAIHWFNNEFTVYDRCAYKNNVITSHRIEPGMMRYYWADSRLCDERRPGNATFILRPV